MYKEVPCPECDGHGFHAKFNEYSAWSERCKKCNGTGIVSEPTTNADRIRAMSDEELAEWMCSLMTAECCDQRCPARDICNLGDNGLVKWMKQPAEEDT